MHTHTHAHTHTNLIFVCYTTGRTLYSTPVSIPISILFVVITSCINQSTFTILCSINTELYVF